MVSEIAIETKLDIPYALLWGARSSRFFMRFLVNNGVLNRMDATAVEHVTHTIKTRKQIYVPKTIDIPAMVKPVFDDTYLEITDTQQWDENLPFQMTFSITPGVLQEYITMNGILTMKPCNVVGDKGCIQTIQGSCQVDIPFVGWYVEQAIITNMKTFYEDYPKHIRQFAIVLATTYADGTIHSLDVAYERMVLEEEHENKQKRQTDHDHHGVDANLLNGVSENGNHAPIVNSISGNNSKSNADGNETLSDSTSVGDTTERPNSVQVAK